jgi:hypothetical protein
MVSVATGMYLGMLVVLLSMVGMLAFGVYLQNKDEDNSE